MEKSGLHLVSFDVPYPANYGGIIDVYFKIKALKEAGKNVILHCFTYNRTQTEVLESLCVQVFYYPRFSFWRFFFDARPMFIASRAHPGLLENLSGDEYPILFEGIHCCAFLGHPKLKGKKQWVRMHNQESVYYSELARQSTSWFKKLYFKEESRRILNFENHLKKASGIFAISEADRTYFQKINGRVELLWPFHGHNRVLSLTGLGENILYHANFGVPENQFVAKWLLKNISPEFKLVLAGSGWPDSLVKLALKREGTEILKNPDENMMDLSIAKAQIIVLPTFQQSGIKLKLLFSLFRGRHILTNEEMLSGTPFRNLCHVFKTPEEMNLILKSLIKKPFSDEDLDKRKQVLKSFSDEKNIQILLKALKE